MSWKTDGARATWGTIALLLGSPALYAMGRVSIESLQTAPPADALLATLGAGLVLLPLACLLGLGLFLRSTVGIPDQALGDGLGACAARNPGAALVTTVVVPLLVHCVFSLFVGTVCVTRVGAYRAVIRSDLKHLATRQEMHYADHGRYTSDRNALNFATSGGVDVTVVATADGWAAFARHGMIPEDECYMRWSREMEGRDGGSVELRAPGEVSCRFSVTRRPIGDAVFDALLPW